jgi:hypothetical protein
MERRLAQIEEGVARYLSQLDTADLQEPSEALVAKTAHLKDTLAKLASGFKMRMGATRFLIKRLAKVATEWPCTCLPTILRAS